MLFKNSHLPTFIFLSITLSSIVETKELLKNGNFEHGTTSYWTITPLGKLEIELERVFNGSYSAYVSISKDIVGESHTYQVVTVPGNAVYSASGYFYDADFEYEIGYAYIRIVWLDGNNNEIAFSTSYYKTTNTANWQFLTTGHIVSPRNAKKARFCIIVEKVRTSEFSKKIYVDDLSFTELGEVKSHLIAIPKNYPNPFNPRPPYLQKTIIFLPEEIISEKLEIHIFSLSGDKIKTIYSSEWDGKDFNGDFVQPGIYLYIVETDKGRTKGKLTVIK